VRLRALLEGHRSTETLSLPLAPGEVLEGVTLRLRRGATLTGSVLDADGKGQAGRTVEIDEVFGPYRCKLQTDEAGGFAVAGLDPGSYNVVARPSDAEVAALGPLAAGGARALLARRAEVEVEEDGGHVVLAAPRERPVRVFGTITVGGRPMPVGLRIELADERGIVSEVQADAGGAYEALLSRPGAWELTLELQDGGPWVTVEASIEGPSDERLDLELPVGSLAGRVYGPDGPLGGAKVTLQLERMANGSEGEAHASVRADAEGRYAADMLPAGIWTVRAAEKGFARTKVTGIGLASGQRVGDVDLHLAAAPARGR
jgi:hypothetical protein